MISSKQAFAVMNAGQAVVSCITCNTYLKEDGKLYQLKDGNKYRVLFPRLKEINYHWKVKSDKEY